MDRRRFLKAVLATPVALALAPLMPKPAATVLRMAPIPIAELPAATLIGETTALYDFSPILFSSLERGTSLYRLVSEDLEVTRETATPLHRWNT